MALLVIIVFALRTKGLTGAEVFSAHLLGAIIDRYRESASLIDIVGSMQPAERFDDHRPPEYLGQFFATIAEPVGRYRGSIDDYVGDPERWASPCLPRTLHRGE